jgi:predicted lipid-binding transport protein (Tim44 family)
MKRSLQEIIELVVFGLIALLLGTALLWLVGAVFGLVGTVLGWLAGLLWALLRFVVPVALIAGIVVLLVRALRGRSEADATRTPEVRTASPSAAPTVDAQPVAPTATPASDATAAGTTPTDGMASGAATSEPTTSDAWTQPAEPPPTEAHAADADEFGGPTASDEAPSERRQD